MKTIKEILTGLEVGQETVYEGHDDDELRCEIERVVEGWRVSLTRFANHVGMPPEIYHRGEETFATLSEAAGVLGSL